VKICGVACVDVTPMTSGLWCFLVQSGPKIWAVKNLCVKKNWPLEGGIFEPKHTALWSKGVCLVTSDFSCPTFQSYPVRRRGDGKLSRTGGGILGLSCSPRS
jgi:hypothetical protein